MAEGQIKKTSLFRETWNALKASKAVWWQWSVGIGLVMAVVQWFFSKRTPASGVFEKQLQDNPQLFKEHPEMLGPYLHATIGDIGMLLIFVTIFFLIESVAFYFVTVAYLRFAGAKLQSPYTAGSYFHWLGQVTWKYTRPSLWFLLPFIGPFFYLRSTIRYALVTPLAILGREPELQTSWDMTENNWWRIFLNQMGMNIFIAVIVWGLALIPLLAALIIGYGNVKSPIYHGMYCLVQGIGIGIGMSAMSIYSCTAYRVLRKEGKPDTQTSVKPAA